jgi:Siphovirus Gp157
MSFDISLYQIESDLASLIEIREQELENHRHAVDNHGEPEAEMLEAIAVIDNQIREYIAAEIRKVDNIRSFWRHCELMRDAAKAEAEMQAKRAKAWDGRLQRLKAVCLAVLETIPFPTGKPKKLEGRTGTISLRGNGGRAPVEISNPDLIPDELTRITAEMSGDVWEEIVKYFGPAWVTEKMGRVTRAPALSLIGEALERGPVAGCRLAERSSHVECR